MSENSLDPSGSPTAYNISVGWKTSEVDLGIYIEGNARGGYMFKPVGILKADKGVVFVRECTMTRWDLQYAGVIDADAATTPVWS